MMKDRVLIIGATGYLGRRLVKTSLALGFPTYCLYRPEVASDAEKVQMLIEFKLQGAHLLKGSFEDHESLLSALKQVDVVISAVAGNHFRHAILEQLKLIKAIKEVGTIKRFFPSEFGMDVDRMEHAIDPGAYVFADKRVIRRAVEKENIPYTYVSANCCAGYFTASLVQVCNFMPPTDNVVIYGKGDKKCIWNDEDDMAMYTMMAVDDPRTLNKTLYIRPPGNIMTQMEVVKIWEKLIGKELKKTFLSQEEWLGTMDKVPRPVQIGVAHLYQIFFRGDLEFEIEGPHGVDSNDLYPEHKYVTVEEYLKRIWNDEDDMAMYTMMAVDDPRTLNKTLYIHPPGNIMTQMEVVKIWEKLIGKELKKIFLSQEEWLGTMDKVPRPVQIGVAHLYQIFFRGDLEFDIEGPHGVDSNDLYPEHKYVTVEEYLKRFA
ncbi:hypothetical protein HHK36_014224 [Tetracentron sinense]|uniref:NmrA-like domain-containing protein n=1 Tax=Tetracentron sinense TaxID=13715 RepID=A0A835DF77_TETSI|nr:hypothetical protein HHK36_014224 [Tetracentron sinense]